MGPKRAPLGYALIACVPGGRRGVVSCCRFAVQHSNNHGGPGRTDAVCRQAAQVGPGRGRIVLVEGQVHVLLLYLRLDVLRPLCRLLVHEYLLDGPRKQCHKVDDGFWDGSLLRRAVLLPVEHPVHLLRAQGHAVCHGYPLGAGPIRFQEVDWHR